jgi:aryl-alcohol dehydrogenase-like predicted oxidoreductase
LAERASPISEIGLGCWQLASSAWGTQDSRDALRIVETLLRIITHPNP